MNNTVADNERAIWVLKNKGEKTIKELAEELGITVEGVRFHLLKLASEGFVRSESRSKGRGRPQQIWSLTAKGHSRFPDTHSWLTVKLIEKIRKNLGEEALNTVITSTGEENTARYREQMPVNGTLEEKIKKLAEIREKEGYMADYQKNETGDFMLMENHCPICAAAKTCQGFCAAELNTFQDLLGDKVTVKRIDHILAGARRCAYVIKEK